VEEAETVCGPRVCAAAVAILLPKLTLVSHSLHYLGRGGTPLCYLWKDFRIGKSLP
jgi:hypothetical protein